MLPDFIVRFFNRSIYRIFFLFLAVFVSGYKCQAQSLGDPIVHITFGSGVFQFGGALKPDSGSTTYGYVAHSPDDNYYTIANSTLGLNKGWVFTTDHTGDFNGYMMIVNAGFTPGLFYTRKVDGLCGSTTYLFSAFIKNILKGNGILPNVTFKLESIDGASLGEYNTGNMIADSTWHEYPFTFSTPAGAQSVVLKMINNAPGGTGNDIAIDDIIFRPYGTQFFAHSDQDNAIFCAGLPHTMSIKTITTLDPNFAQKLQAYVNGAWVDQGPADTASTFSFLSPDTAGHYSYRIVKGDAGNISTSRCVVASNFINITVLPLPDALIQAPYSTCQGDTTVFSDLSVAVGSTVTSWLWDFGDGQTSTKQNPSHVYANAGDFTVKLTVTNQAGCTSQVSSKKIHIIPQVDISFSTSTPVCVTQPVTFTDVATSTEGSITSRIWDYGDGTKDTTTAGPPATHTYTVAGDYTVKRIITTDIGCTTTLARTIVVNPLPVVDFDLPEICYADLSARFINKTITADSNTGLTYLWNFGDDDANAANPNTSALQNPTHYYGKTRKYQVSLTVTSANGCTAATVTKTLQVNGSPVPDFEVLNGGPFCANREVFFKNKSSATVGVITKIIWYFDADDPSAPEVDDNPYPGKLYRHLYPALHYPQTTKTYNVRMVAFTGDANVCREEKLMQVTVVIAPVLSFNPPDAVCLNNGPLRLDAFISEATGIPGAPVFSGPGVSGAVFDPVVAGVGIFVIKCVYTTTGATACADTIARSITVKPIPTVNAGPDIAILAGNKITIQTTATGDSLKYSWAPVAGLSDSTIPNPVVTVDQNVTYILTVTNGEGCSVTDNVKITPLRPPVIPNTFTPNGDGINDTWNIKYLDDYLDCTVDIFNRNGQKVYRSVGYTIAWDGRFNNANLPVGVYYYIIDPKHGRLPLTGYVTIIR
ncbi:PKD domain-containing protein [Mucilaginibacter sp. UR6-11]|uniref:PKD domain-containing protein n=1 Tax=Mucilaginibacter sp. UR6-11 TaxID=1435644 RepID=UPI001E636ECC|nr:PKD domain-containing protein [Mucilaginibacter sp. UR6-11]MCC8426151.1 PKD domain-containing protein [Mucilaginibacter sp. UR6-11]